MLARTPGPFVVNTSTSRVTADIAVRDKCPFYRAAVGEANGVAKMCAVSAVFGGEGNGGVIEPKVGFVRDSFVGMAYVLAGLAARGTTLAEWADSLPSYAIVKGKLELPQDRVEAAARALRSQYADAEATEGDGLRLDWPDRWVQVRASNTEPILRVIAECPIGRVPRVCAPKRSPSCAARSPLRTVEFRSTQHNGRVALAARPPVLSSGAESKHWRPSRQCHPALRNAPPDSDEAS